MSPVLELRGLELRYGPLRALKGLDLSLEKGEVLAVLGSNGAGKSSMLKAISGLIKPYAGDILLDGQSLLKIPAHELIRHGMAHVPEGRRVFSTLSVEENLRVGVHALRRMEAGRHFAQTRQRCFDLFPILGQRRRQLAGTLSGGEQQMLAIARALVAKPRLLLLDEPSLGLAPIVIKEIFKTIADIRKAEGISILLVEQNARQALALADRALVLELGSEVMSGTAAELAKDEGLKAAYLGGHSHQDKA